MARTAAPTPIPAFAPVERAGAGSAVSDGVGDEDGEEADAVAGFVELVVVEIVLLVREEDVVCDTATNWDAFVSHRARTWGSAGSTSKRATPWSQQKAWWSQQ